MKYKKEINKEIDELEELLDSLEQRIREDKERILRMERILEVSRGVVDQARKDLVTWEEEQ